MPALPVRMRLAEQGVTETVYLQKRQGFVRMAIKHGAPIVPVFAFGQGKSYSWYRPGVGPAYGTCLPAPL